MVQLTSGVPLVAVERSGVVESTHHGHLIVLGADGAVRFSAGDPRQPVFGRSSLKPLQAVGLVRGGLRLDGPELALAAASHSGSRRHRDLIAAELSAIGLTPQDLDCPPDLPLGLAEQREYLAAGLAPSRLAMNCSGKHAAMLGACLAHGDWPISGYLSPSHPMQRQLAETVEDLGGERIAATGVDGCGAPVFAISLLALARAFSRIATTGGPDRAVAEAMRAHPDLVAGDGRVATRLMLGVPGLIAKDGAEGVFAGSLPDGGSFAVKIDDGAARAAERVAVRSLALLGCSAPILDDLAEQAVLGGGEPVGVVRAVI